MPIDKDNLALRTEPGAATERRLGEAGGAPRRRDSNAKEGREADLEC